MLLGLHAAGAEPACALLGLSSVGGEPLASHSSSWGSSSSHLGEGVAEPALPSRPRTSAAQESVTDQQYAERWAAAKAVAASLAVHGVGGLDMQRGGAAAVAIAGLAAGVQEAGLIDGGKRVASNPRKEWSSTEDELIRNGVAQLGYKWRVIAAQLPGRSDDAVRNRWSRLQQSAQLGMFSCSKGCGRNFADGPECASHEKTCSHHVAVRKQASEQGEQQTAAQNSEYIRKAWTRAEDGIIMQSVAELGHKWFAIGRRLPGRHCGV